MYEDENMRIHSLTIKRYRVFDATTVVRLSDFTVLTGPNNLGKSTILRALNVFFSALALQGGVTIVRPDTYNLADDYPKNRQGKPGRRWPTEIGVTIELSQPELVQAGADLGLSLPNPLILTLRFEVKRTGHTWARLVVSGVAVGQDGGRKIAEWISARIRYVYSPAARNADDHRSSVFPALVKGAINKVSQSRRRIKQLESFYADVRQVIDRLQVELRDDLHAFLPDVRRIEFVIRDFDLSDFVSVKEVQIDDGARTSLQQKGDGFKSLFSLATLQFMARQRYGANLVFGIEEPESHLHSTAVWDLKAALRNLSQSFQVLITTHSPILIQRDNLSGNIVVDKMQSSTFQSSARPAKTLSQIRESLGIRPQDNMVSAEVILLVEGPTEENAFPKLLERCRPGLTPALTDGRVKVMSVHGAPNMLNMVRSLAKEAASCVVLLDSDLAGTDAKTRVEQSGLIASKDVFVTPPRDDLQETEFEDMFDPAVYLDKVCQSCGVNITAGEFAAQRKLTGGKTAKPAKWSVVMRELFAQSGKSWELCDEQAKKSVAEGIRERIDQIDTNAMPWLRAIGDRLSGYLAEMR
jgi:putative ATP-dependent endonuclease of the OLD family